MGVKKYVYIEEKVGSVSGAYDEREDTVEIDYKSKGNPRFVIADLKTAKEIAAVLQKIINHQEAEDAGV